jgi:hypothetical protein
MKLSYLAAISALSLVVSLPAVASADLMWDLGKVVSGSPPDGPAPWARVTIENVGDQAGDSYDDVKFTMELFLNGSTEFLSRWKFNFNPALDVTMLSDEYISGDQPDNATFVTNEDGIAADGAGKADFEWQWPTANSDDRFVGTEMVMYYLTYAGDDIYDTDFDFFTTESNFVNTIARVQGIDNPDAPSAWIANPEPSSIVLAMLGFGGLGLTRLRRRKTVADAA